MQAVLATSGAVQKVEVVEGRVGKRYLEYMMTKFRVEINVWQGYSRMQFRLETQFILC